MRVEDILIDSILIPVDRARATFSDEQTAELTASIREHGFRGAILVRQTSPGAYELIDGEHRIQVMRDLGYERIPADISELPDSQAYLLNILANTARGSQNPIDVADSLAKARDAGVSEVELAAAVGHEVDWVRLYLALCDLPDHYRDALHAQTLLVGHVREAMRLQHPIEIDAALQSTLTLSWNVKTLKYYVEQRLGELQRAVTAAGDPHVAPPPSTDHAVDLVQYGNCMMCRGKTNRQDLSMPTMCPDCRALLEWVIETLGDPKEAMQTLFNALSIYFEMTRKENLAAAGMMPGPGPAAAAAGAPGGQDRHSQNYPFTQNPISAGFPGPAAASQGPAGPGPQGHFVGPGEVPVRDPGGHPGDQVSQEERLLKLKLASKLIELI